MDCSVIPIKAPQQKTKAISNSIRKLMGCSINAGLLEDIYKTD